MDTVASATGSQDPFLNTGDGAIFHSIAHFDVAVEITHSMASYFIETLSCLLFSRNSVITVSTTLRRNAFSTKIFFIRKWNA